MKNDGRKVQKQSARRRNPAQSERWKRMWADPVWREKFIAQNRKNANSGVCSRSGIPNGWKKAEAQDAQDAAYNRAYRKIKKMKEQGIIKPDIDPRAEKALEAAVQVLEEPGNKQTRLAAARLLLDFLHGKPTQKSEVTINKAEEWLAAVADEDEEQETSSDEEETS